MVPRLSREQFLAFLEQYFSNPSDPLGRVFLSQFFPGIEDPDVSEEVNLDRAIDVIDERYVIPMETQ